MPTNKGTAGAGTWLLIVGAKGGTDQAADLIDRCGMHLPGLLSFPQKGMKREIAEDYPNSTLSPVKQPYRAKPPASATVGTHRYLRSGMSGSLAIFRSGATHTKAWLERRRATISLLQIEVMVVSRPGLCWPGRNAPRERLKGKQQPIFDQR